MSTIHEPPVLQGSGEAEPPVYGPASPPESPGSRGRGLIAAFLAGLVAVGIAAALLVGWAIGRHPTATAAKTGTSLGASAIAAKASPAVVDVASTLGYQNGTAAGTGIVLTSSGEVLTNNHVIEGATQISVTDVGNGRTYSAVVVGYDQADDIAVLQLQGASGLATATLGDSSAVQPGDSVSAIGNAGGRGGTPSVSTGTVTALGASITAVDQAAGTSESLTGLIRTNAALQAGDSGGPLVNGAGQVIGIDTAASSGFQFQPATSGSSESFAIPMNKALAVAEQIEAGKASASVHLGATAFLGVELLNSGAAPGQGADGGAQAGGVTVAGVRAGSPAQSAGLGADDVIVSLDGRAVNSASDVATALAQHHPGDKISIGWADQFGQEHTATVTLATGPAA